MGKQNKTKIILNKTFSDGPPASLCQRLTRFFFSSKTTKQTKQQNKQTNKTKQNKNNPQQNIQRWPASKPLPKVNKIFFLVKNNKTNKTTKQTNKQNKTKIILNKTFSNGPPASLCQRLTRF